MRSGNSAAVALLLLTAGCGTWSNEDIRFLEALPTRPELRVEVPAGAAAAVAAADGQVAAVAAACGPLGSAETWLWAKPTSDKLNTSVDWVIGLVDLVRRAPPTTRLDDGRIWGPWDDDKHPGIQLQVVILRAWPTGPDGPVEHTYRFEVRRKALGGPFSPILSGAFVGPSALRGRGELVLDFTRIRAFQMNDPDSPDGEMRVSYDRQVDPRTVALTLAQSGGFGLAQFGYSFAGYADGRGRFAYAFVNALGDRAEVSAGFQGDGRGRGDVRYYPAGAGGASVGYHQCWSADACLVYSDDVSGYSCGLPDCSGGAIGDCPPPVP